MTTFAGELPSTQELDQIELLSQAAEILGVGVDDLSGWHINRIRPYGSIEADVPLDHLDVEGVPIDPRNVDDLVERFNDYEAEKGGGTGQRDAVVVGHVPGDAFYLVDGFHRHEVQKIRNKGALNAVIEPNLTYERVVSLRIEYAKAHPEVEFARQVEWMQSVWDQTPWSNEIPNVLTAFRAFEDDYAHKYDSEEVELIDALENAEYDALCSWVKEKSEEWHYTPRQIRDNLAKAESFDPELMKLVYQKKEQLQRAELA